MTDAERQQLRQHVFRLLGAGARVDRLPRTPKDEELVRLVTVLNAGKKGRAGDVGDRAKGPERVQYATDPAYGPPYKKGG